MKHTVTKVIMAFTAVIGVAGQVNAEWGRGDQRSRYGTSYGYVDRYQERQGYGASRFGFDDPIDQRQERQHRRVHRGIEDGRLTRKEAHHLHRKMEKIGRLENRFKADGYLSPRECAILQRKLDRVSEKIYRLKHNQRSYGYRDSHGPDDYYDRHRRFPNGAAELGIYFSAS